MGSSTSRDDESDNEDTMEVYLLYKELNAQKYTRDQLCSHHTVLLKHSNGTFYYTDLDVNTKGGPCQLHFGIYKFLNMPIFYMPKGRTRKTVDEITDWVKKNKMAGTTYQVVLNDCHKYAFECIQFLNIFDVPRPSNVALIIGSLGSSNTMVQENLMIEYADSPNDLCLS